MYSEILFGNEYNSISVDTEPLYVENIFCTPRVQDIESYEHLKMNDYLRNKTNL